jgi:hypothetical protein
MTYRFAMSVPVAFALLACGAFGEDKTTKSGLQVGESPTPFNPLHCNGRLIGRKACPV